MGIDPRRVALVEQIAHHGAGDHDAGTAAQGLHDSREGQRGDVRGEGGEPRGRHVERDAGDQRSPAPEAVGDRPVERLADRQADEEHRQGSLDRPGIGGEMRLDRREGRQIHVDRQGREGGQRPQDDDETQPAGRCGDGQGCHGRGADRNDRGRNDGGRNDRDRNGRKRDGGGPLLCGSRTAEASAHDATVPRAPRGPAECSDNAPTSRGKRRRPHGSVGRTQIACVGGRRELPEIAGAPRAPRASLLSGAGRLPAGLPSPRLAR